MTVFTLLKSYCWGKTSWPWWILYRKTFSCLGSQFKMFNLLLSCEEAWCHAGRHNAEEAAESSTYGSVDSRIRQWHTGQAWASKTSKPTPSNTVPTTRPWLLIVLLPLSLWRTFYSNHHSLYLIFKFLDKVCTHFFRNYFVPMSDAVSWGRIKRWKWRGESKGEESFNTGTGWSLWQDEDKYASSRILPKLVVSGNTST